MSARFTNKRRGRANYLKRRSNNVISDRSGFKAKVEDCVYEWNGLFVLKDEYEARHPMDFFRGFPDNQQPKIARPEQPDVHLEPGDVTVGDL